MPQLPDSRGHHRGGQHGQQGKIFRLDTRLNYAKPPLFNRKPAKHVLSSFESYGLLGFDDMLDNYNTQEGSQWDGLGHVGNLSHQAFYNGVRTSDDVKAGRSSIHSWANKFVGKGHLVDLFKFRADAGRPVNPLEPERYSLQDLKDALAAQGGSLKPGSVLLVRTGWMQAYVKATPAEKTAMAPMNKLKACGIEDTREMVAWLWDSRVAAIGTDCPAVEQWPWDFRNDEARYTTAPCRYWACRWESSSSSMNSPPIAIRIGNTSSCWFHVRSTWRAVSRRRRMRWR